MSPWEFRWVLLAIGVAVLVGIWWYNRHQENQRHRHIRFRETDYGPDPLLDPREDRGPEIPDELPELRIPDEPQAPDWREPETSPLRRGEAGPESAAPQQRSAGAPPAQPGVQEAGPDGASSGQEPPTARPPAAEERAGPTPKEGMLVVFHLVMKKPYQITGESLLRAAEEFGLVHGPMDIFHYYDTRAGREPVFSMANLVKPGTFDLEAMGEFSTPGLTLFMQLPVGMDALEAFERLLATAKGLASRFGARLLDDTRSTLTQQTIEHLREQIRMSELRRGARVAHVH